MSISPETPAPVKLSECLPEFTFVPKTVTAEETRQGTFQAAHSAGVLKCGAAFFSLLPFLGFGLFDGSLDPVWLVGWVAALYLSLVGLRVKHFALIHLRKNRLRQLPAQVGVADRYPLASGPHFSIDLVITPSRLPKVLFQCRFHADRALPFQLRTDKKRPSWSLNHRLTKRIGFANEPALRYYYQGDRRQLDKAITAFASELGTVRPLSLIDNLFVCQWLWAEKYLAMPDHLFLMELGHALQKVAMMATRIVGASLPLADLASMLDPHHHTEYRRRALIMLLDGYLFSVQGRALLALEPLSRWHEFAVPVASALNLPWNEAALQADSRALSNERRALLLFALSRVRLYPGAGLTAPSTLCHDFLKEWLAHLQSVADPIAVPHLVTCYYEGILPPKLILEHLARSGDPRITGFFAEVILHGPAAHVLIAGTQLALLNVTSSRKGRVNPFPQLNDADHEKVWTRLHNDASSKAPTEDRQEHANRPSHFQLAEALGSPHRFKLLLRQLQDEDDRACIPHLIACFHLPHMRSEILTFIGREHDERVLLFLHRVLADGSTKEVKRAVEVLQRLGTRLSLVPLQESRRRLGRAHRELIDEAVALINQRYPALAEAGALSPITPLADGAISLVDDATLQGAVSHIESPADKGQISLESSTSDSGENKGFN